MKIGTLIYTWLHGELVGTDEFDNRYYKYKGDRLHGRERRWCLYHGRSDASKVPPEWHAWLHHTVDEPLTEIATQAQAWQKDHLPNMTGTKDAYFPQGHPYRGGKRVAADGDYEAWSPE
jgi:NADH:ubiquinone oxidoreductase subunit